MSASPAENCACKRKRAASSLELGVGKLAPEMPNAPAPEPLAPPPAPPPQAANSAALIAAVRVALLALKPAWASCEPTSAGSVKTAGSSAKSSVWGPGGLLEREGARAGAAVASKVRSSVMHIGPSRSVEQINGRGYPKWWVQPIALSMYYPADPPVCNKTAAKSDNSRKM